MLWNEKGWMVRSVRPIEGMDFLSLTHLYQPLIGTDAFALYITLSYQLPFHRPGVSQLYPHSYLVNLLSTSYQALLDARHRLEGIGLLESFEIESDKWETYIEYHLIPPLAPVHFFSSDILGAMLWERVGKERFQAIREWLFSIDSIRKDSSGRNITKPFQEVFGVVSPQTIIEASQWQENDVSQKMLEDMNGKRPTVPKQINLEPIKMRLSTILGPEAWTKELEEEIQEICFFYQLDSWQLIKALQNPEVTPNGKVNREKFREFVRHEFRYQFRTLPSVQRKDRLRLVEKPMPTFGTDTNPTNDERAEQHFQRLSKISPLELLKHYHQGSQIARADLELVESLLTDFGLPPAVVNVLLDYVLIKYDRKLPRALVEKIAGHWKRLGIQTVEQARNQCLKEIEEIEGKARRKSRLGKVKETQEKFRSKNRSKSKLPEAVRNQLEGNEEPEVMSEQELEIWKQRLNNKMREMNEIFAERKRKEKENFF